MRCDDLKATSAEDLDRLECGSEQGDRSIMLIPLLSPVAGAFVIAVESFIVLPIAPIMAIPITIIAITDALAVAIIPTVIPNARCAARR
jgi:hypothetical protein